MSRISLEIRRAGTAGAEYFEIVAEGGIILRTHECREVLERHLADLAAVVHAMSVAAGGIAAPPATDPLSSGP